MKRTLLMYLFALVVTLSSLPLSAQKVGLTMTFHNEPLTAVFQRLEDASSYKFLFTYDDVNKYSVNFRASNATVLQILTKALENTNLTYKVDGKFINIVKQHAQPAQSSSQIQTVGGYVFDKKTHEPVIGAQIRVVGTNIVTVSDINGAFHFDYYLSGNGEIVVSYVGMKTHRQKISRDMKVYLEDETKNVGEVVVTGIFRKAKESYTGSVSSINKEQLQQFRGQNLLQTLKNVDTSINFAIDNINGSNPNTLPNINIRGNSSLPMSVEAFNSGQKSNPNTPLIIMDGFEISLQKLMDYNDEEIESINILKDAAATAIYGSRGANGVIVIVSKQPDEGKLSVHFEAGLQMEIPDLSSYHLMNAAEKLELERKAGLYDMDYSTSDNSNRFDLLYKQAYYNRLREVNSGVNTDWLAKPLHTGVGQRYNLRVEGGSNEFRWSADAQYNLNSATKCIVCC